MSIMSSQSEERVTKNLRLKQEEKFKSAEDDRGNNTIQELSGNEGSGTNTTPDNNISISNESHSGTSGVVEGRPVRGRHVGPKNPKAQYIMAITMNLHCLMCS